MQDTLQLFKAMADESRLRILRAVSMAELSVVELVTVLGLPQSTVSRHLKPLREAGLVEARRNGTYVYYHRGETFADSRFAGLMDERLSELKGSEEDRASVHRVLEGRRKGSREFFDQIAGSYGSLTEPGGGWQALAGAMAVGFCGQVVVDLGAGEGMLTLILSRFAEQVMAVDHSPRMLRLVEEKAAAARVSDRVRVCEGDLESVPLPDGYADACFLSQALHHAADPVAAVGEALRILKPGGMLIILDLLQHEQEWVRKEFADQWLGFDPETLRAWIVEAGAEILSMSALRGATPELPVLLAVARKQEIK